MLINKMQRYLKFSNYFLKNNKLSIRKKRVSINNNILPILIILFISFIYFLITGVKLYTTVLLIFMTEVYLIFKFNNLLREINGNIDNRFEFEKSVREKQKRKLIQKKNNINNLIIKDENGYDLEKIKIDKNSYIIGKKNKQNNVDIDLNSYKNSEMISRVHFSITKNENDWLITDLGSKNGTSLIKVDKRKIKLKEFIAEKLVVGDIIEIFNFQILVN